MEKKIAVITGASSGIGAAGAVRFAKEGYNLVIAARREDKLNAVAEKCRAEGAEVLVVRGDMSKEEDVKNVFKKALEKFGTIDFVWSNQGVLTAPTVFEELTVEQFYTVSENNFKSTFLMLREATNTFIWLGKPGNVVCTGSSSGIRPEAGFGVYSASKAAVVQLVKDAAIECGKKYNIRYNCVCPGDIDTPMLKSECEQLGGVYNDKYKEECAQRPMARLGTPQDVAMCVFFLCSGMAPWVTGSSLVVDGGGIA